jgi:hypothetical protein
MFVGRLGASSAGPASDGVVFNVMTTNARTYPHDLAA